MDATRRLMDVVDRWLPSAMAIDGVIAIWLFGSLARGDSTYGSDIDLRMLLEEPAQTAWRANREIFLRNLGDFLVAETQDNLSRVVVDGIVVDLGTENYGGGHEHITPVHEVQLLYTTGVKIMPTPQRSMSEMYPATMPSRETVERWITETLVVMLARPGLVNRGDNLSLLYYDSLYRIELLKLQYLLEGVSYAKGYKHLEDWMAGRERLRGDDIYLSMIVALKELAGRAGANWPEEAVAKATSRYCADLTGSPMFVMRVDRG